MSAPIELITTSPLGTRMTVRRRVEGGYTDALGYLREVTETECVVETRRGPIRIPFIEVTAAKVVPPPPAPRVPRYPVSP